MMVYILLILVIIQTVIFGYILWNLNLDVEVLEEYFCENFSDLKAEIQILKEKNDDQS